MHIVKQEKFEGPLDLLLELIQKQKLHISEISLAKVTDEYVSRVEALVKTGALDQEELAEFLVIAGELLLIKSRSLLPGYAASPEEEASIEELETRLARLQRFRALAEGLGKLSRQKNFLYSREPYLGVPAVFYPPPRLTLHLLAEAFLRVYEALPKLEKLAEEKIKRIISLEEKIKDLQTMLSQKVERMFSEVIKGGKERAEVIVSFLAILELAKEKLINLYQEQAFGDIRIQKIGKLM